MVVWALVGHVLGAESPYRDILTMPYPENFTFKGVP